MKISDSSIIMGSTVEHTWHELLPNTTHNLTPLVSPGFNIGYRAFQHSFTTGSSTDINMFFKTTYAASTSELEQVIGLYKTGVFTNLLVGTANVTGVATAPSLAPVVHNSTTGIFSFASGYTNTTATPDAVLTGLEPNTKYFIIVKTQWNDSMVSPAVEFGLALEVASVNVPLKYEFTRATPLNNPHMIYYDLPINPRTALATTFGPQVSLNGGDAYANTAAPAKYTLKSGQALSTTIGGVTTAYVAGDAVPLYLDSAGYLKFAVFPNTVTFTAPFTYLAMAEGVIELTLNTGVFSSRIVPPFIGTPGVSYSNVTVNLGVEVDVSGNIVVFGQPTPAVSNLVVAETVRITSNALYNNTTQNGLIEFWEPSEAIGELRASLATSSAPTYPTRNYKLLLPTLAQGIQGVLNGSLNASLATPFNSPTYSSDSAYRNPSNFGKLALGTYAHYLFGHLHATAAITNDQAIMNAILDMPGDSAAAYDDTNGVPSALWSTGIPTSANIARRLVTALVTGDALTSTTGNLLSIVKQVLGQDASRAKSNDNTAGLPDRKQLLRFINGDKIYFNIKLARPTLSVSNGLPLAGLPSATSFPADNNVNYTIQVTLS
jgi:hypothetical protein